MYIWLDFTKLTRQIRACRPMQSSSQRRKNTCHLFWFLMVILFLSCRNSPRPEDQTTVEFKATAVLPYVKGLSEQLRHSLQQQGVRTVFKSETTLRSHLVRPKDAVDPAKQDGVVYRIPYERGETGRPMQDRIKEHDRDIRFTRTETSAVSEHAHNTGHKPLWNEVKFIDRDPHYYTRRVNSYNTSP